MYFNTSILLLVSLFACTACAQSSGTFDYKITNDIPYLNTDDPLQQLNLLIPEGVDKPPLLLWIGGGAWAFVNRHQEMDFAKKIAKTGIAVAAVGHRLSPGTWSDPTRTEGVKHPAHIQDIAAAFHWLYTNADTHGFDKNKIFVGGYSSGAHLSALLGSDKQYLAAHDLPLDVIKGLIPVAGAYDMVDYHQVFVNSESEQYRKMADTHVKAVFGDTEEGFIAASPSTYIDNLKLPMLLIAEGALYNYTKVYQDQIWESDYRNCQIYHVLDLDHGSLYRDLAKNEDSIHRDVIVRFIQNHAG